MTAKKQSKKSSQGGSAKKGQASCFTPDNANLMTHQVLERAFLKAADEMFNCSFWREEQLKAMVIKITTIRGVDKDAQFTLFDELMRSWFFYLWIPPECSTKKMPSDQTVAARFLAAEGHTLDVITRRYIEAARREPFSYWQIIKIESNEIIMLRDMFANVVRYAADSSIATHAVPGDILFAQVVGLDDQYIIGGFGAYMLKPARFQHLIERFAEAVMLRVGQSPDRLSLLRYQEEFLDHYLQCVEAHVNAAQPTLCNMDGHKIVLLKSTYKFDNNRREEVIEKLMSVRNLSKSEHDEGADCFEWIGAPKSSNRKQKVVKGRVCVGLDQLELECNSEERAKTLLRMLKPLMSMLTHVSTDFQSDSFAEATQKLSGKKGDEPAEPLDIEQLPEDEQAEIRALVEEQHMSWLDAKIPVLNGKTPRQAVRTPKGKMQVEMLINGWEHAERAGGKLLCQFDFNKLRAALGITTE